MAMATASNARRFKLSKFILSWYGILIVYAIIVGLFLLLRLGDGNNPIALSVGSLTFRWYGIIITSGVIIAAFLAQFLAERRGDDPDHVWRILPILLVFGIGFARIWYVFNTWDKYKDYIFSFGNPTQAGAFEIWRGGIAIQGAVVGGIVGSLLYGYFYNRVQIRKTTNRRFSLWRFSDFVAPGLVLAQGIGRWGNFMNNEAYGRQTNLPWGIKIPCEYRTSGLTPGTDNTLCPNTYLPNGQMQSTGIDKDALFHPTFFYESLWDYFTFLVLFFCIMRPKTIERRFKIKLRDGDIFLLYWVIYSIGRFFTEGFRTDSLYFLGDTNSLRTAQVLAIVSILIAGFLLFYRHRKSFPGTQALSMRLAPLTIGGIPATAGVPADAPVSGIKNADVPRRNTEAETDEIAATPVDADNEFDEPDEPVATAADTDEAATAAPVPDTDDAEFDNEVSKEAETEAGGWPGAWPASEAPGSEASVGQVEAATDEVDTDEAKAEPIATGPDAEIAQAAPTVEASSVETAPLVSMDETLAPVAPETTQAAPTVETNPVSGEIENVTSTAPVESTPTAEVPPPAVDTDPKPVDVDLAGPAATGDTTATASESPAVADTTNPRPAAKNRRKKQ
ncbi:MAG: prolipoprotein diacylglyceryl transferase [Chloroflexi bacterium]|nr:prolipoprotein diacylglyceryl transferase [Chloroflexota bacterium]OJW06497.1 MAG: prolipoprotein diacylglyceryl transferase [Chloroflexi bacterium 54-19]